MALVSEWLLFQEAQSCGHCVRGHGDMDHPESQTWEWSRQGCWEPRDEAGKQGLASQLFVSVCTTDGSVETVRT